jgi:GntP family gluconate:H+ symporter
VRAFLKALGEKRAAGALLGSGFVLSVPVFFDTVFYLLVPLARSLWTRTKKNYILYILAIAAGAALTHTLVPPTPGPLYMAEAFKIDLGLMIGVGLLIATPTAALGLLVCQFLNRKLDIPMRPYGDESEPEPIPDDQLPSLWFSLLPVILPVVLITGNTLSNAVDASDAIKSVTAVLGNPNLALLISAGIAMILLATRRHLTIKELADKVERALMSGGIIILVTAAGGAFGAMLRASGLQDSVKGWIGSGGEGLGLSVLLTAFGVAALIKFAQGSGTVSMITTASMFSAMGLSAEVLGFHPVYLATAIGSGSLVADWMNNSGFWIVARMSVLTETETLRSWSILVALLGTIGLGFTLIFATIIPLVQG